MNDEIKNEIKELSLDNLEQVNGGGLLQDLLDRIYEAGKADELKTILLTEGKAVAVAKCCEYFSPYCGFCATAVSML